MGGAMVQLPVQLELWLDALVAVLLLVTVVYCLVLNRRLTALRGNQAEMRQLLSQFTLATRQAEASISELKEASDHIGANLDQRMADARALTDELATMTQSGNALADRIEKGLVGRSGQGRAASPSDVASKISESERELREILRQAR